MSRHRFRRGFTPLAKPEEKFGRTVAHVLQTKAKRMHSAVRMQTNLMQTVLNAVVQCRTLRKLRDP